MNKLDIVGKKFGRLTVLELAPTPEYIKVKNHIYYKCICDCGNEKLVYRSHLLNGKIQSCGCYCKEQTGKSNKILKCKDNNIDITTYDYGVINYKDKEVLFDKEDFDKINKLHWIVNTNGYATANSRSGKHDSIYLHKYIMNANSNETVDHINGDPFDNRKSNLRVVTTQQNAMNHAIHSNNTSGVSGVNYDTTHNKWVARIGYKMKRISLGYFDSFEDAVSARKVAEEKYYGEYSRNNSQSIDDKIKIS